MKYQTKPQLIEAIEVTEANIVEYIDSGYAPIEGIIDAHCAYNLEKKVIPERSYLAFKGVNSNTREIRATIGEFIIKRANGQMCSINKEYLEKFYEKSEPSTPAPEPAMTEEPNPSFQQIINYKLETEIDKNTHKKVYKISEQNPKVKPIVWLSKPNWRDTREAAILEIQKMFQNSMTFKIIIGYKSMDLKEEINNESFHISSHITVDEAIEAAKELKEARAKNVKFEENKVIYFV